MTCFVDICSNTLVVREICMNQEVSQRSISHSSAWVSCCICSLVISSFVEKNDAFKQRSLCRLAFNLRQWLAPETSRIRVYSDWMRRVKFDGYNFVGLKSAFTLSASTRCAHIADIPFTADIILLSLVTLKTWLLLLMGSFPCLGFSKASIIERIPAHAAVAPL